MEELIKLNNQSAGRDKLARLAQYLSKFLWHQMEKRHSEKYTVDRMKNLESTCGSFRKLLRLGRCLDAFYSCLSYSSIEDLVVRVSLTMGKIAHGLYLLADHIVWLTKTGFLNKIDSEKWTKTANKYWLISIVMNLVRDIYEITKIVQDSKLLSFRRNMSSDRSLTCRSLLCEKLSLVFKCHKDVFVDTLKNSCDIFIPLTALGHTKLSPSAVGLLGAVSSIAAIIAMVEPLAKLRPV